MVAARIQDRRLLRSAGWVAAQSWGLQFTSIVVFLALARLLEPSAFGLVAMASLFVHLSNILVDQGMSSALIQRRAIAEGEADTAFWLNIVFGLSICVLVVLSSSLIASLFNDPRLQPVIVGLSLNFPLVALSSVQDALLRREFKFKLLAYRSFGGAAAGGVIGVVMAYRGWGALSLVGQQLTTSATGAALLWFVSGWRPSLRFDADSARGLLSFGRSIVGIRILNAFSKKLDNLLIGMFLGATALGIYAIAYRIYKILFELLSKVVLRVALPLFSAVQQDQNQLREAYLTATRYAALLSVPGFVGVAVFAPEIIETLAGPSWSGSVPVVRVLAVVGAVQAYYLIAQQLLIARGLPGTALRVVLIGTALAITGFFFALPYGITAVAAAFSLSGLAVLPLYALHVRRLLGVTIREMLKPMTTAVLGTVAMASVAVGFRVAAAGMPVLMVLIAGCLLSALTYAVVLRHLDSEIRALSVGTFRRKVVLRRTRLPTVTVDEASHLS